MPLCGKWFGSLLDATVVAIGCLIIWKVFDIPRPNHLADNYDYFNLALVRSQPASRWYLAMDSFLQVLALTGFVMTSANFRVIRYTTDQGQT